MRAIVSVFMFVAIIAIAGCGTEPPDSRPDVSDSDGLGQVEQSVCNNCLCPLGTRCGASDTCQGFPVFGPAPGPACVTDCQCAAGQRCDMSRGDHGFCVSSCNDCNCPLGTRCGPGGTCQGFPVFGPAPGPACVANCQCPVGTRCDGSRGDHGFCVR